MFESLKKEILLYDLKSSLTLVTTLEEKVLIHYYTEEVQLFAKAYAKPRLAEGGAFCSYYFESFMNRRPLEQLAMLIKQLKPSYLPPQPNTGTELFFRTGSPLAIPCEEHLAISTLIKEIKIQLTLIKEINWPWINVATTLCGTWLNTNHEKEENCLFPHLNNLLTKN